MGMLVEGQWLKDPISKENSDRPVKNYNHFIGLNNSKYKPMKDRYHLYASYACPWANQTLIYRGLKNLENIISVSIVHPDLLDEGWFFDDSFKGATKDHLFDAQYLREIYQKDDLNVTTRVSVPILWDKETNTIVSNESSEIIRMFNCSFNELTQNKDDFYPIEKRKLIDSLNKKIYSSLSRGVYKTGFAKTQTAYDEGVFLVFKTLDELEQLLKENRYLAGDTITEVDLCLIPTLLRFDVIYLNHFKCNIRRIKDYKNLSRYTKELYEIESIKKITKFEHIKRHYYYSHVAINPYRIIAKGPINFL